VEHAVLGHDGEHLVRRGSHHSRSGPGHGPSTPPAEVSYGTAREKHEQKRVGSR
jgi:hypothetical protein